MAEMSSEGETRWSAVAGLSLADVYLAAGALQDAMAAVDASLETFSELQDVSWTARGQLIKAEVLALQGNKEGSYSLIRDAIEVIAASGDRSTHADALIRLSRVNAHCGDITASADSWNSAIALLPAGHRLVIEGAAPWL